MIVFLFCWATLIQAAVPQQINYQGRLTDAVGKPLDGTYTIRFYLYDAPTGGTLLWNEEQSVVVADGIYNVQLGSVSALDSDVFAGDEVYLEVVIYNAATTNWETLSPRQQLTSTAYAFQTENAQSLEGHGSADFASALHQHSGVEISKGTVDEARIDPDIARDSEISWSNLSDIPADIADGDQTGITTETDPTITDPSVKDGVSWVELSGIPAGFADGVDNEGLTEASDYGRFGVSSTLYEGSTALTFKYVGKSGSHTITNGNLTVNTPYGIGAAAVTGVKGFAQSETYGFGVLGQANGSSGYGVYGSASGLSGSGVYGEALKFGVFGKATDDFSNGVRGESTGGFGEGVHGKATGSGGMGIYGEATDNGAVANFGGRFYAWSTTGTGVFGAAENSANATNYGGYFSASGTTGIGVHGSAYNIANAINYGGYFEAGGYFGRGVYGKATDTEHTNHGGFFEAEGSTGRGVYGGASGASGRGVYGQATATGGSDQNYGGYFVATGGLGRGVHAEGGYYGVYAEATKFPVYARATGSNAVAVEGVATVGNSSNWGGWFYARNSTSASYGVLADGDQFDFYAAGPGTNYGAASSIRWKKNIQVIEGALEKVLQMRGVYFDWDEEHGGHHDMGFIAEEVGQYVPEIVSYEKDSEFTTGMDYGMMTPILLQAIKEQQEIISELRAEIEKIKDEIKTTKAIK